MSAINYDEQPLYYNANNPKFKNLQKVVPEKPLNLDNLEVITIKFLRDSSMYDVYGGYKDFEKFDNYTNYKKYINLFLILLISLLLLLIYLYL